MPHDQDNKGRLNNEEQIAARRDAALRRMLATPKSHEGTSKNPFLGSARIGFTGLAREQGI